MQVLLSPTSAAIMAGSGLRTLQIAHQMKLKPVTLEYHFRKTREKPATKTREQALVVVIFYGYIDL